MGGSKSMKREFALYPKYQENYIRTFDRMIQRRKDRGLPTAWNSGEECFMRWIGDDPNQVTFDDMFDTEWAYV
jgi:phosphoadenosine phosphosulfate reductase